MGFIGFIGFMGFIGFTGFIGFRVNLGNKHVEPPQHTPKPEKKNPNPEDCAQGLGLRGGGFGFRFLGSSFNPKPWDVPPFY